MAGREQRVDDALQQLIYRLIPSDPDEDEGEEDERFDEALNIARDIIDSEPGVSIAEDVNHAADLIKKKLIRENDRPDKAAKFSNLYSRLLSQPVLTQKWAILYFLYQLSDSGSAGASQPPPLGAFGQQLPGQSASAEELEDVRAGADTGGPGSAKLADRHRRHYSVGSPAFNDAFARDGLPRLPPAEDPNSSRPKSAKANLPLHTSLQKTRRSVAPFADPEENGDPQEANVADKFTTKQAPPTEGQLLRDLPFTLQGLSSTHLSFSENSSLILPPTLPIPLISLLHTLAEPSLLYRSLSQFVESSEGGLIGQSLRSAIGTELRSYLGLVATLEGQIKRALIQLAESPGRQGLGKAGVTLKRCVVWTRDATMGLRLMSMIVEESKGGKGGQIISLIHSYSSSHGDPFVHAFAERLLVQVTKPFYAMLQHWIYEGELEDPFQEFFVEETHDLDSMEIDPRRGGATSVWEDKYKLNESTIPSIVTSDFAKKIFLIGKSLNFIRYGCGDSTWVENHSRNSSQELRYGDTATLETSIDSAYKQTMARLIHLMDTKFMLFEHLAALKKYLLLGQGDFIALLMESLASNLDRPANSQYRHTLTAQLEHAIRNSNAQYDHGDVLRRLDARMLELSHGEIGWDVFTLEYRVDSPLDVIVTPWASKQYLKVFNFLWRVKRVEFALGSTWRRCITGARGVLGAVGDKVGDDWKSARGGMAEMIHFVSQLQHYILFEVIEAGWEGLQRAIRNPDATLDTLISAHTSYLRSITRKGLLASPHVGSSASASASPDFTSQLHELLKLMLAYKDAVDNLYSYSVAEFTRRQDLAAKIETRTAAGGWGRTEQDDDNDDDDNDGDALPLHATGGRRSGREKRGDDDSPIPPLVPLPSGAGLDEAGMLVQLRGRLRSLATDFRARVNVLLGDLAYQPDVDMRFLGVVMNFNDVYQPVRRRRRGHGDKEKTAAAREGHRDKDREARAA